MANKYARHSAVIPERTLFDTPETPGRHLVRWSCTECDAFGNVPQLFDATKGPVLDAIGRGHARRNEECHRAHELTHVVVEQGGKRLAAALFAVPSSPTEESDAHAR